MFFLKNTKNRLTRYKRYSLEKVSYKGKEYTKYEATQVQRQLETAIRKQKDRQIIARASGNDDEIRLAQQKISQFISLIDEKIGLLKQKHTYYQDFKKYLMQQIFAQKLRFNFDDEWKRYNLGDISTIGKGFTPSTSNPEYWDGDINWLSIADMNQGKYITETSKKITEEGCKNKKIVEKDTLIMSFKLTIGRLGILKKNMFTNEAICNFKWKNNNILTEYMYYYLSSINILKYGSQAAKGITLNNETLNSIPVYLPDSNKQKEIVEILLSFNNKIDLVKTQLTALNRFKKGLLQKMFI